MGVCGLALALQVSIECNFIALSIYSVLMCVREREGGEGDHEHKMACQSHIINSIIKYYFAVIFI